MGLKVLTINAGNTTDIRLVNTKDNVMMKIDQLSILDFFGFIWALSDIVVFFNICHISVYVFLVGIFVHIDEDMALEIGKK